MDSGRTLRIIFGVSLVIIITVITIMISSSLSVGGTVYRGNPEACASCHIEAPYVEGWRGSPHYNGNVTCMDCHQYNRPISDAQCLACHQDYDARNITKFLWLSVGGIREIDAHLKKPHIPATCTTCHIEHKFKLGIPRSVTENLCRNCHVEYRPPQP